MKLSAINIMNFLGVREVQADMGDITIFAGNNWSGKSSIQQAIRIALSGEVARVKLKGEYGMLVREGAKEAIIGATMDDGSVIDVNIPLTGKAVIPNCDSEILKLALDQHRFSSMDEASRRSLLIEAIGIGCDREAVLARMHKAGADPVMAESIIPLLRSGFDAAEKEAEDKAKANRAAWKAVTGETYGAKKADAWVKTVDADAIKETASNYAKIQDDINKLEQQIANINPLVDAARSKLVKNSIEFTCEECGAIHKPDADAKADAESELSEMQSSLKFMTNSRETLLAKLGEASAAADRLDTAEQEATAATAKARDYHLAVVGWAKIQELMSPSGIVSELVAESIKPLNDRLLHSSQVSGFGIVQVRHDMSITFGNRLLPLCSEAEQWLADAMLCEAIAFVSGLRMVILDRIDVLAPSKRGALIGWAQELSATDGVQFILFGTLKNKPEIAGVKSYWVDEGKAT